MEVEYFNVCDFTNTVFNVFWIGSLLLFLGQVGWLYVVYSSTKSIEELLIKKQIKGLRDSEVRKGSTKVKKAKENLIIKVKENEEQPATT